MVALLETAVRRKADSVLVQEPPKFEDHRHPAFVFLRAGRVLTARRIDSDWTVSTEDRFTREVGGNVQVLALSRHGHQERAIRVVNTYRQGTGRQRGTKLAERAL